jgi:uncharacterized membrane-anchored protein
MLFLVILALLGMYLAFSFYRYYGVIARGVSGGALVYLLFYFGKRANLDQSNEELWLDPHKTKYFVVAFVAPILFWFAYAQIIEMIFFFLK